MCAKPLRRLYEFSQDVTCESLKNFSYAQILPDDPSKKPQAKQLQGRAEYLLKLLKKEQDSADMSKAGEEVCCSPSSGLSTPLSLREACLGNLPPTQSHPHLFL